MNKWLVYVLGMLTGIVLTVGFALCVNYSDNSEEIDGLELFESPGEYMDFSKLDVGHVVDGMYALANVYGDYGTVVFVIPNNDQHFYDGQRIVLESNQRVRRVGSYRYYDYRNGLRERTVSAIKIVDCVENVRPAETQDGDGKTLFDKPGGVVSSRDFQVQRVLASGDAIALEVAHSYSGYVSTSDLEVLMLAQENRSFYNNQILKAPQGKSARQIGVYKYREYGNYGDTKVIPIIAFE